MKKSGFRAIVAVITIISLLFGCCGVGIFAFADSNKPSVVVNDGTKKSTGACDTSFFTHSTVSGVSPDGSALSYKAKTTGHDKQYIGISLNTGNITDLGDVRAISFYLKIPSIGTGNTISFGFTAGSQQYNIIAKKYIVPKNGEVEELDFDTGFTSTQFEGNVILMLPDEDEIAVKALYGGAGEWTWKEFMEEKGLSVLGITLDAAKSIRSKEIVFDTFTIHYNQDKVLGDYNIALNLPIADVSSGYVSEGTTVNLTADEGCDIHYTLDGSDPDKNSKKFDINEPIIILADTTVKAIAVKDESVSGVATYTYKLLTSEMPNTTILNDGENTEDFTYKSDGNYLISAVSDPDVSPYGNAPIMTGHEFSAAIMLSVEAAPIDKSLLSANNALAYWVQSPGGVPLVPYFNNEMYLYGGKKITYNSATGEVKEYTADQAIPNTDPFEGWIILTFEGDIISQRWGYTGEQPKWTWTEWVADKGVTNFQFYCAPSAVRNRSWTYDQFVAVVDVNKFLDELKGEGLRPNAPTSEMTSGIAAKNAIVELVSTEGAEIYYTLDGTKPSKSSTKYDPENPIVVAEPLTLNAIAYLGDKASSITTYEYTFLDSSLPNTSVLNNGENAQDFVEKSSDVEIISAVLSDTVSPYGNAPIMTNSTTSGAIMLSVPMEKMDANILSAHQALAFWAKVPAGAGVSPCIDNQKYPFKGTMVTYNSSTGAITEYADSSGISFKEAFEGWIILKLEGVCVQEISWSGDQKWTWRQRALAYGLTSIQFYTTNSNFYGKEWTYDEFTAIIDYDKFMEQIKAEGLRPMAPTASPGSDAVPASTNINLTAGESTTIYYTVDGSNPSFDEKGNPVGNTLKYVMIGMGNGQPDASPIAITDTENPTVVKTVAVDNVTGRLSGIAVYTYTVEPEYDGPNSIVVNDGSGEGKMTFGWHNTDTWEKSISENDSSNGKGLTLTTTDIARIVQEINFTVDTTGVEQVHNFEAISYHIDVPTLSKPSDSIGLAPRVSGTANYLNGIAYTISDSGEVKKYTNSGVGLNGFKGTVLVIFPKTNSVGVSYGSTQMSWFDFIKSRGLTSIGFYFTKNAMEGEFTTTITWDDFTIHYDVDKYLEEIGLEDLLANYGAGTFENANMLVSNDCSGKKINSGITAISDNLILEPSDYSPDERCFKLTFGEGDANLVLPDYCEDEMAIIGDGVTFWVEMPKGSGDVPINITVKDTGTTGDEVYTYSGEKWYYRIDKDGVIEKVSGKVTATDGFRGWFILPNDNFLYMDKQSVFTDGVINYEAISNIDITFENKGGLTGKSAYFDDMSYYTDFAAVVRSRALRWHENTVLLDTDTNGSQSGSNLPGTGDNSMPVAMASLLSVSVMAVMIIGKKRIV